jgi:transposase
MGATLAKRAYKYRFYPTEDQVQELLRTFGCIRLVCNKALEARIAMWQSGQRRIGYNDTSAMLTEWKTTDDLAFLGEVSPVPLQQALRHLQKAFIAFWNKHARFKSRKLGIDVGLTNLVTLSTGEKISNPRHWQTERRRQAKAQRALSRKQKGSNASRAILAAGRAGIACGDSVRPTRR